jgi:uncharacterized peroxidase-related enzyme
MTKKVVALEIEAQSELSEATKAYFAKCEEKLGLVPNVLLAYAFDEKKLRAFTDMYNDLMLGDSGLSKLDREMIAVAVSSVNHCYYCLTAHGAAVRQLSDDPKFGEQIAMNYRAAELSPKQKAMLDFAVKLTERPDMIEESDRIDFGVTSTSSSSSIQASAFSSVMRIGGVRRTASSLPAARMLVSFLPLSTLTSRSLSRGVLADDHALIDLHAGLDHHRAAILQVPQREGHRLALVVGDQHAVGAAGHSPL